VQPRTRSKIHLEARTPGCNQRVLNHAPFRLGVLRVRVIYERSSSSLPAPSPIRQDPQANALPDWVVLLDAAAGLQLHHDATRPSRFT
jgi:hypothetical protein